MHDYANTLEDAAEARLRDFCADLDAPLRQDQPTRGELLALHRMYGERIAEARTLADMRVGTIADRMGLEARQITALEQGTFGDVPAWLLARVANVTKTRLDYLAGLSDESEQGEGSELREIVMGAMLGADTECAIHALGQLGQRRRIDELERLAGRFEVATAELVAAFRQFVRLNSCRWPDMPGGARLDAAVTACARHAVVGVAQ